MYVCMLKIPVRFVVLQKAGERMRERVLNQISQENKHKTWNYPSIQSLMVVLLAT